LMWINATGLVLRHKNAMSYDQGAPRCPNCGKLMRHTQTMPKLGGLSELRTFACRECGEAVTEAVRVELLARAAHTTLA
jgi:predicted RNA-binding Zn-ribbon protein involved in translation (DUF1610 family)